MTDTGDLVGMMEKYDYKVNLKKQRKRVHVNKGDSKLQSTKHARLEYIYLEDNRNMVIHNN
jgi:hypothetical protein